MRIPRLVAAFVVALVGIVPGSLAAGEDGLPPDFKQIIALWSLTHPDTAVLKPASH